MDEMFKDFIGEVCIVRILDGNSSYKERTSYIGRVDRISVNHVKLSYAYLFEPYGWWKLDDAVKKLLREGHSDELDKEFRKYSWPKMLISGPVKISPVGSYYKNALFNDEAIARFF